MKNILAIALIAIIIPPLLVLALEKGYRRIKHHPAVEGFGRGLSLAMVGVFVVVLVGLLFRIGLDKKSLTITLASLGLCSTRRVPIFVILIMAGVVGLIF